VAEALCFGWIDGVRRRIDAESYQIRFTPRRRGSTWSAVNIGTAYQLIQVGRLKAAGMRAVDLRNETKSRTYSYEQEEGSALASAEERLFRAKPAAWAHFMRQPRFREKAIWWVRARRRPASPSSSTPRRRSAA